jgi:gamma-glutamyltranspeptidase / glutathione hydrolase
MDADGNAFSATPSDGVLDTPLVPDLGVIISPRGKQFWLDPDHPSCVAPGKRPRLTPNPGLVMKDGHVGVAYGIPGLDVEPQAMTPLLVNLIDDGDGRAGGHRGSPHRDLQLPRYDASASIPPRLAPGGEPDPV